MKRILAQFMAILFLLPGCGEPVSAPDTEVKEPDMVEVIMSEMSLSDKVYQLMFVTPEAITGVGTVIQAGEATKAALSDKPVGGIIYFQGNLKNAAQTKEMIENTQSYAKIPLFIGVDEEGGIVSRLGSNPSMGVTHHPPMKEIGKTENPEKAYEVGKTLGSELLSLGFNVDFAPVADVLVNSGNSVIGNRSFGTEPETVAKMVSETVRGMQENGVSATLKHFPGHGSTYNDSHTGYTASQRTLEELRGAEFVPFKAGIASGVDFIMVAHITMVNATSDKLPATLSKEVTEGMLKGELGYKGIVITDAMNMGAIANEYTTEEATVKAIQAGCDMILMPKDLTVAHNALIAAVASGEITEERIDESVRKILTLKTEKGMIK